MIGLVIVSHSARLAEGAVELAREMAGPDVPLIPAGGLDLPGQPLGTDAMRVLAAIQRALQPVSGTVSGGVLVLVDMGSAILSTEMALEMLDPDQRERVAICEAPLVEGAVAAAIQARLGSSLAEVRGEAVRALVGKAAQIGSGYTGATEPETPVSVTPTPESTRRLRLTVNNPHGLHARPAARLVRALGPFSADVQIANLTAGRGPVSARSINAVATLGVRRDHEIEVSASGPDAAAALADVRALAETRFGETDEHGVVSLEAERAEEAAPQPSPNVLTGISGSPGLVIGTVAALGRIAPEASSESESAAHTADPQAAWQALQAAIARTREQIQRTQAALGAGSSSHPADIFDAHLLFLEDEALLGPVRQAILTEHQSAAAGWRLSVDALANTYTALDDEYQRARAADVREVGDQVLAALAGNTLGELVQDEPGILIAVDLTAAQVAQLDPAKVLGIATALGGPTAHSTILARSLGIPAVVGLGGAILSLAPGTRIILDGSQGHVLIDPDSATLAAVAAQIEQQAAQRNEAQATSSQPAVTQDGHVIEVAANIGSVADALLAVRAGADAVGVLRTEFLFLDRPTAPDEETQYGTYRAAAANMGRRPVIIRTLDVGGDKPLPYIDHGQEMNPYLGLRAVRLCLAYPELFKTQLRAIVRVAVEFPIKVMFPMIATLDEWRAARSLLNEARAEVAARGIGPVPERLETGIMVEIPSAALLAEQFAPEVDFFSIGTNDLTQYTLAAERGNPRLAALGDSFQPAVLRLIAQVVTAAHAQGKWVGVCGEMAGDPLAVPLLVALGVDELSMNAPAIATAKQMVRRVDRLVLAERAAAILRLENADSVRQAALRLNLVGPR